MPADQQASIEYSLKDEELPVILNLLKFAAPKTPADTV
jgi:hypothetical protein